MADDRITISLELEDGKLVQGFGRVEGQAQKAGQKAGDKFQASFGRGLGRLVAAAAAAGTAIGAALFSRQAIRAAAAQEEAINNLETSLRTAGTFSEEASEQFQNFARELQSITTIGDEVALGQLALARNFARSNEEAIELVRTAADLSAATGISLDSAVRNLGKTFSGLTGELGEAVPQVRGLTAEQLKAGEAVRVLAERFGGAAQAQVRTFNGALIQLQNTFGDFLESIGSAVTSSPEVIALFNQLSTELARFSGTIREAGEQNFIGNLVNQLVVFAESVNTLLIAPLEIAVNVISVAFEGIRTSITGQLALISTAASRVVGFFAPDSELAQNLSLFSESSTEQFNQFSNNAADAVSNVFNTDFSESSAALLERLREAVDSAKPVLNELPNAANTAAQKANQNLFNIGQFLAGPVQTLVKNGVARIGASLIQGGAAFEGFGKFVLGVIGDLLINIGFAMTGIGKAIESLKVALTSLSGGLAVAAGIALIALGGVLKGLAGGAGGIGTAGTATGPAAEGTTPAGEPFVPDAEEEDELDRGTRVTVNVEGTILDPVGTATQIAELLTEITDSNDIVVNS